MGAVKKIEIRGGQMMGDLVMRRNWISNHLIRSLRGSHTRHLFLWKFSYQTSVLMEVLGDTKGVDIGSHAKYLFLWSIWWSDRYGFRFSMII